MGFERVGDLRVEVLPRAAKQAAMRRVLDQRVLEAIDRLGRRAALEEQLGGDETAPSNAKENSRPTAAPVCATSRTDAKRSSRAISESCKLVGMANGGRA